jgi:uncharacterized protein YprB with RNaseH-like and TPR domain
LFFDIETSPNIGLFWNPGHKISISHENIIRERAIICIAWKWEGQKAIHCLTWNTRQNDKAMLKEFVGVMHKATEIVAHNGDRFDTPWIRTRCLYHGIPMSPDFVSIDTLKAARAKFRFNSNRLDYVARFLAGDQKRPTGFGLWKRVLLDKDPTALRKMVGYCKHDVKLLEEVYQKLAPYLPAKTHRAAYVSLSACPECGSQKTCISRHRTTASGYRQVQYNCRDCGKYHSMSETRWLKSKAAAT